MSIETSPLGFGQGDSEYAGAAMFASDSGWHMVLFGMIIVLAARS
jgi:hypothetical protein